MMVPGSRARLLVGTPFTMDSSIIFRFERAEIRMRAPRIPGTNSEGLPGAIRGSQWQPANMNLFKRYPYTSNLPGIGEWEVRVTQAHWDYDQCIFKVPAATPIIPQRYVAFMIHPHVTYQVASETYIGTCMYVEEASHTIEVARGQPVDFTMYSNGPFQYPITNAPEFANISGSPNGIAPSNFPIF